jgi:hypothetical protein
MSADLPGDEPLTAAALDTPEHHVLAERLADRLAARSRTRDTGS